MTSHRLKKEMEAFKIRMLFFSLSKEKQGQVKQVENLIPWYPALTDWYWVGVVAPG